MKILLYLLSVVVVSGLLSSSALALTPLGPPRAGLKKEKSGLGFVFARSEMDLEVSGYGLTDELTDTESNVYLVRAGYGISDGCEIYSLVGFSDISSEEFKGDSDVAWGFGSKFTFAKQGSVTWGGVFQFLHISSEDSVYQEIPDFGMQEIEAEVQYFDIQIAFGPTYTKDAFSIYGGPFLHFVEGDVEGRALGVKVELDIEQKSEFGGYIGTQFKLNKSTDVFMEYQMTGDASAIAGGIVWRF